MLLFLLQALPVPPTVVWYRDPITVATIVIAVATTVYVFATILLWRETRDSVRITREMFEASHRPYVGADRFLRRDQESQSKIIISVEVKNFGSVPALDLKTSLLIVANGLNIPESSKEDFYLVLHPGTGFTHNSEIYEPHEYKLVAEATSLVFVFVCTYKGVAQKEYRYECKVTYRMDTQQFGFINVSST